MKNLHQIGPSLTEEHYALIWYAVTHFHSTELALDSTHLIRFRWPRGDWDFWPGVQSKGVREMGLYKQWLNAGKPIVTEYKLFEYTPQKKV